MAVEVRERVPGFSPLIQSDTSAPVWERFNVLGQSQQIRRSNTGRDPGEEKKVVSTETSAPVIWWQRRHENTLINTGTSSRVQHTFKRAPRHNLISPSRISLTCWWMSAPDLQVSLMLAELHTMWIHLGCGCVSAALQVCFVVTDGFKFVILLFCLSRTRTLIIVDY